MNLFFNSKQGQLYLETWAWIGIGFKNGDSAGNVPMQDGDFIVGIFSSDGVSLF